MIRLFALYIFCVLSFSFNDTSINQHCARVEKSNENYLLLNDTTKIIIAGGEYSVKDINVKIKNGTIIKTKIPSIYKVITKNKKDVEILIFQHSTNKLVYSKVFKVLGSIKDLKENAQTNTLTSCMTIQRHEAGSIKENRPTKFIYYSNTSDLKITCENGIITSKTDHALTIKPNISAKKIRIVFKDSGGEIGYREYLVRK